MTDLATRPLSNASAPGRVGAGGLIAGLDIGGTKLAVSLACESGILARRRSAVPLQGTADALGERALDLIDQCCAEIGVSIEAVSMLGVSSCGPFSVEGGLVSLTSPNLCGGLAGQPSSPNQWLSVPIEQILRRRLPRLRIVNDASAALLAEHRFGVLAGASHCAYVTWSTGIGVGLMVDGRLLRGKAGNAGHAGHWVPASPANDARLCGCGNRGDLESICGGAALARRWGAPPDELFRALRAGDSIARGLIDSAVDALSASLYNLIVGLDLERIAVGGSLFCAQSDLLLPALRERTLDHPGRRGMQAMTEGVRIESVSDAGRTAELGALCLALPEDWGRDWAPAGGQSS